jgi:hypothetical protein
VEFTIAFLIALGVTIAVCLWPPSGTRFAALVIAMTTGVVLIVTILTLAVVAFAAAVIVITLAIGMAVLLITGLPIPPQTKALLERVTTYLSGRFFYEV